MFDRVISAESLPFLGLAWVLFVAVLSGIYRANKGKPVFFWSVPSAQFIVHFASGHSGRSLLSALAGANSCLVVAIANGRFIVRPWFPFNLLFLPEIYGIECDVPLDWVVSAECPDSRFSVRRIVVQYHDEFLQTRTLSLRFRDPERLLSLLSVAGELPR